MRICDIGKWPGKKFTNVEPKICQFAIDESAWDIFHGYYVPSNLSIQVLSWEWRFSWSSADKRSSNYICVINKLIAYQGAPYIRGLT